MKCFRGNGKLLLTIICFYHSNPRFSNAFIVTPHRKTNLISTSLSSSTAPSSTTETSRRKVKTISDRTQEETLSLIQDVIQATVEAGPRGGIARTLQAYYAVTSTLRDFLPAPPSPPTLFPIPFTNNLFNNNRRSNSQEPETFSAPVALRKLFERMGATYIKLGQFIASSPTLFPEEYVVEFQKCLDQTEPLPWSTIQKVIETELGGPISNTFASVEKTPLASASIAQVHKAVLKDTGETVVLKVQKPNIEYSLKADLSFIYVASRILEFVQPDFERTSISAIAGDVRTSMLEELNFEKEAENVEEFRRFLKEQGLTDVATAPRIYREFTSKKLMTMEYLRGVSLLDPLVMSSNNSNAESIIVTALNVWTQSVLTMPFFHADVHAGNLLALEDGRIGFIDFGIVGKISPAIFEAVTELSGALAAADYEGMAKALCKMGATDEEVDIQKFGNDIERVINSLNEVQPDVMLQLDVEGNVEGAGVAVAEQEVTQVLLDVVGVTEDNGLKLPREFGLLVKQSLYFDRFLKILAPSLDVMADERVSGFGNANGNANGNVVGSLNGSKVDTETGVIDV